MKSTLNRLATLVVTSTAFGLLLSVMLTWSRVRG